MLLQRPSLEAVNFEIIEALSFKCVCVCVLGRNMGHDLARLPRGRTLTRAVSQRRGPAAFLTDSLTVIVLPPGWVWGHQPFVGTRGSCCGKAAHGLDCPLSHCVFALWSHGRHVEARRRPRCGVSTIVLPGSPGSSPARRQAECQAVPRGLRGAVLTPLCPAAAQHLVHRRRDTDK